MILELMKNRIVVTAAVLTTALGIVGGIFAYDDRLAKCEDVKALEREVQLVGSRLDQKILADRLYILQDRIWRLESQFGGRGVPVAPQVVRDEYYHLLKDLAEVKRQLESL
jgi:hypothetical protein